MRGRPGGDRVRPRIVWRDLPPGGAARLAGEGGGVVRRAEPGRAVIAHLGVAPERVRRAGTVGADGIRLVPPTAVTLGGQVGQDVGQAGERAGDPGKSERIGRGERALTFGVGLPVQQAGGDPQP
jgi:hypothetical protein